MSDFIISTDSACDFPLQFLNKIDVRSIAMHYSIGSDEFTDKQDEAACDAFYNAMKNGAVVITSQVTVEQHLDQFNKLLEEKKPILHLAFSSGLSGTAQSAQVALNSIKEERPDAPITLIDTLAASAGHGLIVYTASKMRESGSTLQEIAAFIEEHKLNVNHWYTVDDLQYLKRGGRISSTAAVMGTLLDIKPILTVNAEGKLVPYAKVKGRKKAIKTMLQLIKDRAMDLENATIMMNHSLCLEEAEAFKQTIIKELGVKDVILHGLGPIIGAHTGPSLIVLGFWGKSRKEL